MGRQFLLAGWFFLACIPIILAKNVTTGKIVVDGTTTIAETDENYICMTIDLWPLTLCPTKPCVWEASASLFNLNLSLPTLIKAVQGFKGLRIRVGGTLQDILIYDVGSFKGNCHPFQSNKTSLFEYSKGCLYMERWDELNSFFSKTGAIVTFGLNALIGKHKTIGKQWEGDWNYENAEAFIQYTVDKNYQINSWELGNEMAGSNSIGASITAEQYAKDSIKLREIIDRLYKNSQRKPLLVAPGSFFDPAWYSDFAKKTGFGIVDVFTHHIYNMGSGKDPRIINNYLNPTHLSRGATVFKQLEYIVKNQAPWSSAWVGESGGAFGGGAAFISNTFVNGFWYIDQLGMAASHSTKVYCRQTLIGGHYGILSPQSLAPTPDYYGALLFHRLMGRSVLKVNNNVSAYLRTYAHCSRGNTGVTMLFINLSNQTDFTIEIENNNNNGTLLKNITPRRLLDSHSSDSSSTRRMSQGAPQREEYHLTPSTGLIKSPNVLLNGNLLKTMENGDLPNLTPIYRDTKSPINIATWSIVFVVIPDFVAPTCK